MEAIGNMAPEDLEIAGKLCELDPEFRELWEEHRSLKETIKELNDKRFLTTEEEVELKRLKRLKLLGKDKIVMKINEYKVAVSSPA